MFLGGLFCELTSRYVHAVMTVSLNVGALQEGGLIWPPLGTRRSSANACSDFLSETILDPVLDFELLGQRRHQVATDDDNSVLVS